MIPQIEWMPVSDIKLDPNNPRLPERSKWNQGDMISELFRTEVLEELARSMLDKGFFAHEPIIVTEDKKLGFVAVEGNRRLATLKILLKDKSADGIEFALDREPTKEELARLEMIPVIKADRDAVNAFIGFRHIGGIKLWSPEAKARWTFAHVEGLADSGEDDPFRKLAEEVGTDLTSVRSSFTAYALIRTARDEHKIVVDRLVDPKAHRFGVWLRCMSVPNIRIYIGLGSPSEYEGVIAALKGINGLRLAEVLEDIAPKNPEAEPLLSDSRNVTEYGKILVNDRARKVLRKTGDFDDAKQIVDGDLLPQRIARVAKKCDLLRDEMSGMDDLPEGTADAVRNLHRVVQQMRTLTSSGE